MRFLFLFLLSLNIIASDKTVDVNAKMSKEEPKILLDSISEYAIRIGTGNLTNYYIFVDPMCPHSKNFIKLISKNRMQQIHTSYYIFLYRLPKFDSDKLIQRIYQSPDIKSTLLDVMVDDKKLNLKNLKVQSTKSNVIKEISIVSKKMKIKKRPYMIVFEKGSNYCTISEGSAPCLEEFDF